MKQGVFITGTDTDCGKTVVSVALIRALRKQGITAAGFKPVAAGARWHDGELRNDDSMALIEACGFDLPYQQVNPYCFEQPIAPHLAARETDQPINMETIRRAFTAVNAAADIVVVEGAGGWRVPLGANWDMQSLAQSLGLPVVLVVGLRLGCLNHAQLSEQVILDSGVELLGWIGSHVDPNMERLNENIASLEACLQTPCLGVIPNPRSTQEISPARPLNLGLLINAK